MLHIVDRYDTPGGGGVLHAMFEARKQVFVDLLKWDVPVVDGRFEVDQFDGVHAVYLIVTDATGSHRASARLLPTCRPHILGEIYPQLCAGPVPTGASVFEITRFCLDRQLDAAGRRAARDQLVSALADYGVANGIGCFTGVAEFGWLQQILAFGWRCRPLGLPRRIGGTTLGALAIDIDADTPTLLARAGIYTKIEREMLHAA